jgi:hypothetical protein
MAKNPTWTKQDEQLLIEHYPLKSKEELCSMFPNRSWNGIKQWAYGRLKLTKLITARTKNGNVGNLLEETPEAYYWMGFLLADGSFDKDGRVNLTLSEKDKEQVYKFAMFIETDKVDIKTRKTNFSDACTGYKVSCLSTYYGPQIREKFNLRLNKTENPPDLATVLKDKSPELILSLIIGFIDGDGSIQYMNKRKSGNIKVEVHSSWLSNLVWIENFIYTYFNINNPKSSKIDVKGYAKVIFSRTELLYKLNDFTVTLKLPVISRKWNLIKDLYNVRVTTKITTV